MNDRVQDGAGDAEFGEGLLGHALLLTALAGVALFVLSGTLVHVLLGGGKFTADDVAVIRAYLDNAKLYPAARALVFTGTGVVHVVP